ncbi:unnamed protein product [Peronospora belbahrii]|uniref:Uncharacterized protein n=1 Tax=Peronospora belbahrii TaxID=622444 RepID=A0ABN8D408_9STRA|nr:unnamed protein product [Peronospora belbahrii]
MGSGGKAPRRGNATQQRTCLQGGRIRLQSTVDSTYPSSRLLVWHSYFSHALSRHESVLNGHAFNQQLEVFLPSTTGKTTAESLQWESGFYYDMKSSLDVFLSPSFIREYLLNDGTVVMVTKNVALDASQSAMLLPSGELLLLVDAHTYHQLGIVGEKYGKNVPATCRTMHVKQGQKYVITLDLTSSTFVEEGKNWLRDRVKSCLSTKLEQMEMVVCAYNQHGSARTILFGDDDALPRSRVELNGKTTTFSEIFLPRFDAFYKELGANDRHGDEENDKLRISLQEAYDWLGLVACRLTSLLERKKLEEYVSTFTGTPDLFECKPDSEITTVQRAVKNGELPWGAVTVWGFPDVFVSSVQQTKTSKSAKRTSEDKRREHGYLVHGSNNYTLLMLPNDEYFMLQALGPHDATV